MNHQKRAKVMIEMQKRIKRLGKSLWIQPKIWKRQQAKFKDILGKDNQGKKIKKIKNIPKMNHQKRAKVMIEMQKRIKRLGKSFWIQIKIWKRQQAKFKDILGRKNKGKRLKRAKRVKLIQKRVLDTIEIMKRDKKSGMNF
jgi:hypothetical protein